MNENIKIIITTQFGQAQKEIEPKFQEALAQYINGFLYGEEMPGQGINELSHNLGAQFSAFLANAEDSIQNFQLGRSELKIRTPQKRYYQFINNLEMKILGLVGTNELQEYALTAWRAIPDLE